jgi:hypothetical protein
MNNLAVTGALLIMATGLIIYVERTCAPGRVVDGRGIGANEAALRLLADFGFMELVADADGRLKAEWTEAGRGLLEEPPSATSKGQP